MNLGQLLQKVKDLIAAAKANNYIAAITLMSDIFQAIVQAIPPPVVPTPQPMQTMQSEEQILTALEQHCHSGMFATADAPVQGPVIDAILPLLIALLKKWLGLQ